MTRFFNLILNEQIDEFIDKHGYKCRSFHVFNMDKDRIMQNKNRVKLLASTQHYNLSRGRKK
jgi:hypothetical protein